jgi:tRNA (guanine37-N1)-methyltransferase
MLSMLTQYNVHMQLTILTLFPEYFTSPLQSSIIHRAQLSEAVKFNIVNIRDFATDKHHTTDDRPFGGGAGMVMKIEPIDLALRSLGLEKNNTKIVLTSAKGKLFNQQIAESFAKLEELVIICGHYEGVDERVAEHLIDEEIRIGDFVLTGGEGAALVIADAVTRLLPKVLGNPNSLDGESHQTEGQFGYPQYTRPEKYEGWVVPETLLGGNHKEIEYWRQSARKKSPKK